MTFNFRKEVQEREQQKTGNQQATYVKKQGYVSKHTYKINNNSNTIVVSFIYPPDKKPNLEESKIVHILKNVIKDNPLECPPRIYGHKFYINLSQRPNKQQIKEIQQLVKQQYPDCKVFAKLDRVTQREKQTIYVGKLLGVDKEMMETYLREELKIDFKEVRIAHDKETGRPKNFGYIEFNSEDDAHKAVDQLAGVKMGLSDGIKATMMVDE